MENIYFIFVGDLVKLMLLSDGISVILSDLHPNTVLSFAIYTPCPILSDLHLTLPCL